MGALSIPLFRHELVVNPRLLSNGSTTLEVTGLGLLLAPLPALFFFWALVLFRRDREKLQETYFATSIFVLLIGFVVGGVLNVPIPVLSLTNTLSLAILGRGVLGRQVFNPLKERAAELERQVADREKAEDAYRSLVEHSMQGLAIAQSGRVVYVNPALVEMSGYSAQDWMSLRPTLSTVRRMVHREDQELIWRLIGARLSGRTLPPQQHFRFVHNDGSIRWTETRASHIQYRGQPAVQVAFVDITERKRAERALQALNEAALAMASALTLDQTLAAVGDAFRDLGFSYAVLVLDESGARLTVPYLSYNRSIIQQAERLVGLKLETISIPIEQVEALRRVVTERQAVFLEDASAVVEIALPGRVKRFSRQIVELLGIPRSISAPLVLGDRVIGVLSVQSNDLTERDRPAIAAFAHQMSAAWHKANLMYDLESSLAELRRAEGGLASIHALGQKLVLSRDAEEIVQSVTEAARKVLHFPVCGLWLVDSERGMLVRHAYAAGPDVDASDVPALPLDGSRGITVATARSGTTICIPDITQDSRYVPSRFVGSSELCVPIQVSDRVIGVLNAESDKLDGFGADDVRLLEALANVAAMALENARLYDEVQARADDLLAALVRVQEVDHLKSEFIQNVSHELRQPLALIRGYAELLVSGELGELCSLHQEPLEVIARRTRMLSDLVEDITLILGAEVRSLDREQIALDTLVQGALQDFRVVADQAELELEASIGKGLRPVRGEMTYLRRVLDNLLGNAVKFTPPGGTISVRVEQSGEQAVLEVSDTGIGIHPDQQERVFERFYQVDGSMKRRYGGVGLGLALVREVVGALGGQVGLESEIGKGTTFTVTLPSVEE
jgi:PAS domain S-box-containing protein